MLAVPPALRPLLALLVLGPLPGCATAILWDDFDFHVRETTVAETGLEIEDAGCELTPGQDVLHARVRVADGPREPIGGERAVLCLRTQESHGLGGLDLLAAMPPPSELAGHALDGWHLELFLTTGPDSTPLAGTVVLAGHGRLRAEESMGVPLRDAPALPEEAWRGIAPEVERWQRKVAEACGPRFLSLLPVAFVDARGGEAEPPRLADGVVVASPDFRLLLRLRVLDRPAAFLELPGLLLGLPAELEVASRQPDSLHWEYRVPCAVTILPAATALPADLPPLALPVEGRSWLRHLATSEHFDWEGTTWRILLTPLALVLDILGGALLDLAFGGTDEDEV